MSITVFSVLALAVLDSINPSAIVVTLYLLSRAESRVFLPVVVYLLAIFVTYLMLGAILVLGLDSFLPSLGDFLPGRAGFVAQSLIGLALLVYAVTAPTEGNAAKEVPRPSASTYAALAVLGVSVTAVELPTAIPYFAAIAIISEAKLSAPAWAPLLVAYNVIFILPPVVLLVGQLVLEERLKRPYAALRARLESSARETMLWVAGIVGTGLLVTGVIEVIARSEW